MGRVRSREAGDDEASSESDDSRHDDAAGDEEAGASGGAGSGSQGDGSDNDRGEGDYEPPEPAGEDTDDESEANELRITAADRQIAREGREQLERDGGSAEADDARRARGGRCSVCSGAAVGAASVCQRKGVPVSERVGVCMPCFLDEKKFEKYVAAAKSCGHECLADGDAAVMKNTQATYVELVDKEVWAAALRVRECKKRWSALSGGVLWAFDRAHKRTGGGGGGGGGEEEDGDGDGGVVGIVLDGGGGGNSGGGGGSGGRGGGDNEADDGEKEKEEKELAEAAKSIAAVLARCWRGTQEMRRVELLGPDPSAKPVDAPQLPAPDPGGRPAPGPSTAPVAVAVRVDLITAYQQLAEKSNEADALAEVARLMREAIARDKAALRDTTAGLMWFAQLLHVYCEKEKKRFIAEREERRRGREEQYTSDLAAKARDETTRKILDWILGAGDDPDATAPQEPGDIAGLDWLSLFAAFVRDDKSKAKFRKMIGRPDDTKKKKNAEWKYFVNRFNEVRRLGALLNHFPYLRIVGEAIKPKDLRKLAKSDKKKCPEGRLAAAVMKKAEASASDVDGSELEKLVRLVNGELMELSINEKWSGPDQNLAYILDDHVVAPPPLPWLDKKKDKPHWEAAMEACVAKLPKGNQDRVRRTLALGWKPLEKLADPDAYVGRPEEIDDLIARFSPAQRPRRDANAPQVRVRPAYGALIYGPPGTGKTKFAKALALRLGFGLLEYSHGQKDEYIGVGPKIIQAIFEFVMLAQNVVLFLDEVDSLLPPSAPASGDPSVQDQLITVTTFATSLTLLDDFMELRVREAREAGLPAPLGPVVLFATNCPAKIDSRMYRRLNIKYHMKAPDPTMREAFIRDFMAKMDREARADDERERRLLGLGPRTELEPLRSFFALSDAEIATLASDAVSGGRGYNSFKNIFTNTLPTALQNDGPDVVNFAYLKDLIDSEMPTDPSGVYQKACEAFERKLKRSVVKGKAPAAGKSTKRAAPENVPQPPPPAPLPDPSAPSGGAPGEGPGEGPSASSERAPDGAAGDGGDAKRQRTV